jgi:glycyl-tRNA synthetase beta chain
MAELLLEIGIEEVPARMLSKAVSELSAAIGKLFRESNLVFETLEASGAPRQLLVFSRDVQEQQEDREETVKGPPVRIAFDAEGRPTRALEGFLKKNPGVSADQLERMEQPRGEILIAKTFVKGLSTREILAKSLPGILQKLSFPKKMKWGNRDELFVRPIRNILGLFGGEVIPFEFAGVKSGNLSFGHRFHGKARFEITGIDHYLEQKKENAIVVRSRDRVASIKAQLEDHLTRIGGRLVPDEGLMRELPELVEVPFVVCGQFSEMFLEIPREILITSLREHQKSFCVEDEHGKLMPYFMAVASTVEDAKGLIKKGNEWVLKARLWDAHFFWNSDRKKDFETLREKLKNLVFQVKIGDYYEKTERIEKLSTGMGRNLGMSGDDLVDLGYAARHCKSDLFSELVFEFPELQGVIGGLLLEEKGMRPFITKAVYEHYLPNGLNDDLPGQTSSALVSVSDKLDTLVGCFAVGLKPTGTKDPYALRRAAQGVIRVLMELNIPLNLVELVQKSLETYRDVVEIQSGVEGDILDFFVDRMRYMLKKQGFAHDLIEAVLSTDWNRVDLIRPRAQAVQSQLTRENFISLFRNLKRMNNVIQDEFDKLGNLDESLFESDMERDLWTRFSSLKPEIESFVHNHQYAEAMDAMGGLVDPVEAYFSTDGVFVNCDNDAVRLNRKAMLRTMRDTLGTVADLTRLEIK